MAVAAAAALLDELMGRSRNDSGLTRRKDIRWDDPEYCKYYMVQFCPHDLFVNTRADLGPCPKVHCDEAKGQYLIAQGPMKDQYEDDFLRFAQSLLNDVDRKITKGEQRLALMGKSEPMQKLSSTETQKNEEQISLLNEKINNLVKEAEQMGIQGNVEQAQGLMKLCDQLKEEKESLLRVNENSHWSNTMELAGIQEKQMEVCKVCGAFLIVGDAQSRIDDHLMGKQHTGYGRLKSAVNEIIKRREDEKAERDRKREEERCKRIAERAEKEKKRYSGRSRSPRKHDRFDRGGRNELTYDKRRSRDLDKSRDRYKAGSSRDRNNRDRDRNGRRYSREKDRDRKRSRDNEKERHRDKRSRSKNNSHRSSSHRSNSNRSTSVEDKRNERRSKDTDSKKNSPKDSRKRNKDENGLEGSKNQ